VGFNGVSVHYSEEISNLQFIVDFSKVVDSIEDTTIFGVKIILQPASSGLSIHSDSITGRMVHVKK